MKTDNDRKASYLQFLAAFTALLGALCMGTVLSYTSPAIVSMQGIDMQSNRTNSEGEHFLDEKDIETTTWIISVICIGGLIGSFIAGSICEYIGHRWFLCISSLVCTFGWLFISLASTPIFVIIGRFVTGFAVGLMSSSVPVYIVEISTLSIRGFLGCSFQGFITLGILFITSNGMFVDWRLLAQLCMIPSIVLAILILYFPESPYWLIKKGKQSEALKSLKRLRTSSSDCDNELNQIIEQVKHAHESIDDNEELIENVNVSRRTNSALRSEGGSSVKIINESFVNMNKVIDNFSIDSNDQDSGLSVKSSAKSSNKSMNANQLQKATKQSSFLRDLKLPHIYKPLIFGMMIMFFQQMSGSNGLFSSLEMILNSAKLNQLNEQQAALVVNLCFAVFAWLSTYTVNLFGRKTLLMFSSVGYILAYILIGGYYWAKEANYDEFASNYSILPLIALILFFFVHAQGYGSVCWFVIPEMSVNYRNQISSICVSVNWIMSFVVMKNFTKLCDLINYSGTFLFLAFIGLLSAICVAFLPETKDKTAKQIKAQFYSK